MEQSLNFVDWRRFLGFAAGAVLGDSPQSQTELRLGEITLHPHQLEALARLEFAVTKFGGALLADDVGLGKTFVALAVARRLASRTIVAAPTALCAMWIHA